MPVVLVKHGLDKWDIRQAREIGATDIWAIPASPCDAMQRIQTVLRLKIYMDEQARFALFALARSFNSKRNLRNGHSDRLMTYTEQLGKCFSFGEEEMHELRIACWLHDIGKIAVPESILLKPGPLDAAETKITREHPIVGEQICAPLKSLR
jgi:putative two-component system response regulator